MARTNKVIVRLTDLEKAKILAYAEKLGVSMSEVVQDWIKALPDPKTKPDGD
jgi:translation elongation factor EF-4